MTARISAISTADASVSASAGVMVLAPHQIAVRQTPSGIAEFYDRNTGRSWVARGNNFIRLANQTDFGGNSTVYHSTFNIDLYDSADTESALTAMQASGYNAVRVFLSGCCIGSIGNPAGGLAAGYMANVADFLAPKNWQIGGCGYGLRGWLLWTWDTPEAGTDVWNATAGDGSINAALAPVNRPDPCVP